jgi:hypothetical protein
MQIQAGNVPTVYHYSGSFPHRKGRHGRRSACLGPSIPTVLDRSVDEFIEHDFWVDHIPFRMNGGGQILAGCIEVRG